MRCGKYSARVKNEFRKFGTVLDRVKKSSSRLRILWMKLSTRTRVIERKLRDVEEAS
jgi:hypothetical protein